MILNFKHNTQFPIRNTYMYIVYVENTLVTHPSFTRDHFLLRFDP